MTTSMSPPPTDPLLAAIDHQAAELITRAAQLRRAAESDDVGVADRALVLVTLGDMTAQLDDLLDRLGGGHDLLPEDAA